MNPFVRCHQSTGALVVSMGWNCWILNWYDLHTSSWHFFEETIKRDKNPRSTVPTILNSYLVRAGSCERRSISNSNVCAILFFESWENKVGRVRVVPHDKTKSVLAAFSKMYFFLSGGGFNVFLGFFGNFDPKLRTQRKRVHTHDFASGHEGQPCQTSFSNSHKPPRKSDSCGNDLFLCDEAENGQIWPNIGRKWTKMPLKGLICRLVSPR